MPGRRNIVTPAYCGLALGVHTAPCARWIPPAAKTGPPPVPDANLRGTLLSPFSIGSHRCRGPPLPEQSAAEIRCGSVPRAEAETGALALRHRRPEGTSLRRARAGTPRSSCIITTDIGIKVQG